MSITITGTHAWAEHAWRGQELTIGEVTLRVIAPVPRCMVTTRNPESGATDARILHALARLRGNHDITFGVWCDILRQELNREATPAEVRERLGWTPERLDDVAAAVEDARRRHDEELLPFLDPDYFDPLDWVGEDEATERGGGDGGA